MARNDPFVVLMVDDDDDDWVLVKEAFQDEKFMCDFRIELHRLADGQDLVEYLHGCDGMFARKTPRPDIILLDLNMPRLGGKATLQLIKSCPSHRRIPVVIFTTSKEGVDVADCYDCGASSFIVKPGNYQDLRNVVRSFVNYWICTARLAVA